MNKKSYINFLAFIMVFVLSIYLLIAPQPSVANIWVEDSVNDVNRSVGKLSIKIDELIELEKERNEILKRIESKLTDSTEAKTDKNE